MAPRAGAGAGAAGPVDEDQQLAGGQVGVHPVAELALLSRVGEVRAQPDARLTSD